MINSPKSPIKKFIIVSGFTVLLPCYCWFIWLINGNSVIYDEVRIIADFFTEYQQADSLLDKVRALFRRENETFPAFIRLLYLISYWLLGNVRFDWLAYFANAIPPIFLCAIFFKRKDLGISAMLVLVCSFLILNPYSDHIFLFTYASLFYFISILFPIVIVYAYVKKLNCLMICLLVVLGLSSSTYFIIGLMLLVFSTFERRWKTIRLLAITLLVLKLIPILLFDATDSTNKSGVILKSFSYIPELAKLFFLTLGSWVQVINSDWLNEFALPLGIVSFLLPMFLLVRFARSKPKDDRLQFYGILFVYFWLIFFSTTVFRWNFNYDYQYNAIFSPSKSFFVLVYFTLVISFIYGFTKLKIVKTLLLAMSSVFVISYFLNYYQGINHWKTIYKSTVLAGINYKTQNNEVDYRNLTFKAGYSSMVEKKLLIPAPTPFDKIDLEGMIMDSSYIVSSQTGVELFDEAKKNEVNMYNISIKPIILYSYLFPFSGKVYNRMDGTYFYLTSPTDKFILPTRYVHNSVANFLFRGHNFNTDWMIGTIENSFSLEVAKTTYEVYLLQVVDGEFSQMIKINKQLRIMDTNNYQLLDTN